MLKRTFAFMKKIISSMKQAVIILSTVTTYMIKQLNDLTIIL